ncbi:glycosyltransferase family 32 protein [Bergeyella sp. RCAD1439]|uniref:glycosyltransferase family 32 protein n=1 Tax=Bergeyella anatis TaxID=3113737 RepID=UPI002E1830AF|nr:glycosyltransferase [Bergeyella sp. RCAD1439]
MAIPKQIFQTFKNKELPWLTRWHIKRMLRRNPDYQWHFYDDEKILQFFREEMPAEYERAYRSLTIGAAKADFFRYAILYKKGGIYLDIDCKVVSRFRDFLKPEDQAVISIENNDHFYVQWALFFEAGHPFLKKTLQVCLRNIQEHRFPHDVHKTTGPPAFTEGIHWALNENPDTDYREMKTEYEGHVEDKYKLAKFFLYSNRKEHWNKKQLSQPIIKPVED